MIFSNTEMPAGGNVHISTKIHLTSLNARLPLLLSQP